MANLVLNASAVVRIIEGAESSASFQQAVLHADLVLAPELLLTEVATTLWRLQRAGQLDHPLDDCLVLALARREGATLLTADQRLQDLANRVLP